MVNYLNHQFDLYFKARNFYNRIPARAIYSWKSEGMQMIPLNFLKNISEVIQHMSLYDMLPSVYIYVIFISIPNNTTQLCTIVYRRTLPRLRAS